MPMTVVSYLRLRTADNVKQTAFGDHIPRILHADLTYPIIIDPDNNILDGCHRLCKYYLDNVERVPCIMLEFNEIYSICGKV